jgi:folate-binding protein YgfZ
MPREMIAIALKALKKYAIFFKVELTDASDELSILGILGSHLPTFLENGVAMIYPETSGVFLPHEINLPQLNGVSFNKGCYTGQEIIARVHYRGKLKNQLHLATCEEKSLVRGNDIFDKKGIAGKIVDYVGNTLLIVTHDASQPLFLNEACNQPIQVNHVY